VYNVMMAFDSRNLTPEVLFGHVKVMAPTHLAPPDPRTCGVALRCGPRRARREAGGRAGAAQGWTAKSSFNKHRGFTELEQKGQHGCKEAWTMTYMVTFDKARTPEPETKESHSRTRNLLELALKVDAAAAFGVPNMGTV